MSIAPIVRTVRVALPPARAFDLFTGSMGKWWPADHHIATTPFVDIVVEPEVGGRWYERDAGGAECTWGKVLEWGPPDRVVFGWQLTAGFKYDPDFLNEVELTFEANGAGTLVTLTHHNLQRFGVGAAEMAPSLGRGWALMLELYGKLTEEYAQ
jgi:uncharacterized protein YndB with AHSA1/START domain